MRLIIAGGRDYCFTKKDTAFLDKVAPAIRLVIIGGATGADYCGEQWAKSKGIPVKVFPADWENNGKGAGPIRNLEMAKAADGVVLFPGGRGTDNMFRQAEKLKLLIVDRRNV